MLSILLVTVMASSPNSVKVAKVVYETWSSCYRISNRAIDVVVVPQIGRIMRLGELGKRNLLWEGPLKAGQPPDSGGWKNWGGDKVWPSPQSAWPWPPEEEYDGSEWTATPIKNGIKMVSGKASKKLGARFEREITLDPDGEQVHIVNRLINSSGRNLKAGVWEICQVDDPPNCIIPAGKNWKYLDKSGLVPPFANQEISVTRDTTSSWKYGGYSQKGTLTAHCFDYDLSIHADARPQSSDYPDGGCNLELFSSPNPLKYCELEVLDPLVTLKPGATASMKVTLSLGSPIPSVRPTAGLH